MAGDGNKTEYSGFPVLISCGLPAQNPTSILAVVNGNKTRNLCCVPTRLSAQCSQSEVLEVMASFRTALALKASLQIEMGFYLPHTAGCARLWSSGWGKCLTHESAEQAQGLTQTELEVCAKTCTSAVSETR
jgi:hypothetical protein